jgi:heme-degrading monooxygenase HmoA
LFAHLAIHHVRPGREPELAESMHRFAEPLEGAPGFGMHWLLRDDAKGVLVGVTTWDRRESWAAVIDRARSATEGTDFGDLWSAPPDVFELDDLS